LTEQPALTTRYRIDDLRRLTSSLAASSGLAPARGSALASHLLWFDAAGASSYGIASLPTWLDRLDRKEIDPMTQGRVVLERAGTAVFDAEDGLPPLALDRAAGIASEKARDVGIGLVRIKNLGQTGPSAPVAAALAIGPYVAIVSGPDGSLTIALPGPKGLPMVHDSQLRPSSIPVEMFGEWSGWISAISSSDNWSILAISVTAFEPLEIVHERMAGLQAAVGEGQFALPRSSQSSQSSVVLDEPTILSLKFRADRLGLFWPSAFAE
jgi:hypothetical protein